MQLRLDLLFPDIQGSRAAGRRRRQESSEILVIERHGFVAVTATGNSNQMSASALRKQTLRRNVILGSGRFAAVVTELGHRLKNIVLREMAVVKQGRPALDKRRPLPEDG